MQAIGEVGLLRLRMEDVGRRAGMSPGHILYYFRTKQRLLLETLRWSEGLLAAERARRISRLQNACARLRCYVELYLPERADQPNWRLWLHAWTLAGEPDVALLIATLDERWQADLDSIVALGLAAGDFSDPGPTFAAEFQAVLDGLSVHLMTDRPPTQRRWAVDYALRLAAERLQVEPPSSQIAGDAGDRQIGTAEPTRR